MRLTNYSDYAVRSLIYLAVRAVPPHLANISDIANSYGISRSHLTKIVHQLGQLGYIESVRGKNGGIRLARKPEDINLGVLIKQIEPDFDLAECFATPIDRHDNDWLSESIKLPVALIDETKDQSVGCTICLACQFKNILLEALSAFIGVLERYTLADIINNHDELVPLLFR